MEIFWTIGSAFGIVTFIILAVLISLTAMTKHE